HTQADYSTEFHTHKLVEARAEDAPDAIAVACGNDLLSYQELNRRANQLARYLKKMGVKPETPVAVCLNRSAEMVVAQLAILKSGGAYLPLDPEYPKERLEYILEDASAPVVITGQGLAKEIGTGRRNIVCVDGDREQIRQESRQEVEDPGEPENLAYVIYTSGSTGKPKGVQISHRSLLNLINWHKRTFAVTPADRATQVASPAFDASVWELWPYLTSGASIHIPDEETRSSPHRLRDW